LNTSAEISLHAYLKAGDWVRVVKGPFAGCMGILQRQNPKKGRLVVSVDLIQRSVSVEMNVEDIEPIEAPPPAPTFQ
jgi:transcription termination/antitermination protein NusG